MNIKTITTWADYNYGASLQAYALLTFLKKAGHEVEMIQYLPPYQTRMYDYWWVNPESKASRWMATRMLYRIAKWAQRQTTLGRKRIFDEFNFKRLPLTKERFRSFDELCVNPPEADLYIVGSDQVWNVLYEAGRDNAFFLEFVNKGRKASYAASFSFLEIDDENKERIAKSLTSFDAVAVREYHGKQLVESMGIDSTWVLDPVFLLSIDDWKELTSESHIIPDDDCLLVYDFEGNKELEAFVKEYANRNGLKIYAITDKRPLSYADKNFKEAGPIEFVRMIAGCKAFVSNSFHGTAFSIMFHKPVFVFNRNRHKVNSRMESLLTAFDMQDVLLDTDEKREAAFTKKFDWEKVERLKRERLETSYEYLKKIGV